MSDTETRILREVLATMVAEAPPSVDFENLTDTKVMLEAKRARRSPWIAAAAGFVVVVITIGGLFALTHQAIPGTDGVSSSFDPTIFMMPEFVPDDIELVRAEVTLGGDLTQQVYHQEGLVFSEAGDRPGGERIVHIVIVDRTEQVNDPEPDKGTLVDLAEYAAVLRESDPQLVVSDTLIRGKPALVIEGLNSAYEATETVISVFIDEGMNIVTELTSEQLPRDTVIAIAEGLRPTSPSMFDTTNWSYQDISNAASVWLNQLGLNQTDDEVWSNRLDVVCATDSDLRALAERYIAEDAGHSVRSDGTLPAPEEGEQSLDTIRLQTCER